MPIFFSPTINKNTLTNNDLIDLWLKGMGAGLKAWGYTFPGHSYKNSEIKDWLFPKNHPLCSILTSPPSE